MQRNPSVSIVIPAYNEAACLRKLEGALKDVCAGLPYDFEFLFVNDGSTDHTEEILADLARQDSRVRYLVLSRNFGHQGALSAGLACASGDAVIMMDADLQHPPSLIPRLLETWRQGYDIVNTIRLDTAGGSASKAVLSRGFYWVFRRVTGTPIEPGSADFRLMARQSVEAFNRLPERHRFIRGLVPWLGFRQTSVTFHAPARWAGRPKYTFRRSLRLALEGITAFTFYPLRFLAIGGFLVMAASAACGLWTLGLQLLSARSVTTTTWLWILLHFYGGSQLATLGIMSEYLGRTLEEVKGRPIYIVRSAHGFPASVHPAGRAIPHPHVTLTAAGALRVPTIPDPAGPASSPL
jgi:dolichol-phosphate mannosyltransferase